MDWMRKIINFLIVHIWTFRRRKWIASFSREKRFPLCKIASHRQQFSKNTANRPYINSITIFPLKNDKLWCPIPSCWNMRSHINFRREMRIRARLFDLHLGMTFFFHSIILINHLLRLLLLDLEVNCSSKSKITKLHHTSLKIHENILRLQVSMQHLTFLTITQP